MRFGMWAAAAAALVCAGQADATTWVKYEATGTGIATFSNAGNASFKSGDVILDFVVEVDPQSSSSSTYYSTGSYFNYLNVITASINPFGKFNYDQTPPEREGQTVHAAIDLPQSVPYDAFPSTNVNANVTGTLDYISGGDGGYYTRFTANLNKLVSLGEVSGLENATVSILPEPATWAMMILGMGAIGFAMRRQRKVRAIVSFA